MGILEFLVVAPVRTFPGMDHQEVSERLEPDVLKNEVTILEQPILVKVKFLPFLFISPSEHIVQNKVGIET